MGKYDVGVDMYQLSEITYIMSSILIQLWYTINCDMAWQPIYKKYQYDDTYDVYVPPPSL